MNKLQSTLQRIKNDPDSFNQRLWVTPDKSCGCFAWHAIKLHGTPEQRAKCTWDYQQPDKLGCDVLGITPSQGRRLFWAMNTIDDLDSIVNELSEATPCLK